MSVIVALTVSIIPELDVCGGRPVNVDEVDVLCVVEVVDIAKEVVFEVVMEVFELVEVLELVDVALVSDVLVEVLVSVVDEVVDVDVEEVEVEVDDSVEVEEEVLVVVSVVSVVLDEEIVPEVNEIPDSDNDDVGSDIDIEMEMETGDPDDVSGGNTVGKNESEEVDWRRDRVGVKVEDVLADVEGTADSDVKTGRNGEEEIGIEVPDTVEGKPEVEDDADDDCALRLAIELVLSDGLLGVGKEGKDEGSPDKLVIDTDGPLIREGENPEVELEVDTSLVEDPNPDPVSEALEPALTPDVFDVEREAPLLATEEVCDSTVQLEVAIVEADDPLEPDADDDLVGVDELDSIHDDESADARLECELDFGPVDVRVVNGGKNVNGDHDEPEAKGGRIVEGRKRVLNIVDDAGKAIRGETERIS